ncbi:peptidase M16 [Sphaerisporangium siamense]|uniref:Putative Zn-dependent peptidase n=1 Tax=Sphaerisporangium siamense TaxID=795645 RepID=A0A7W7G880_9ACTN|nr:pitrilysin family protein [Sphaerisporangium siamense]MBB4701468.1 putative Zn-dependent peptidase [Sphaerisporangium siamense]GII85591.1 peptidase M16 [Sphaerisporangium siamense]
MRAPVRTTLANGVPVLVLHRPGATATTVTLWLLTGSRYEQESVAGGTHLLEHILMQAPLADGSGRPIDLLEGLGGEGNAITSRDHLVLYGRVPSPEARTALGILARALARPGLTEEVLESERKVVQEELRLAAGDPFDVVHDVFYDVAFGRHPLARPVGGTAESVGRVTLDDLHGFHSRWVRGASAGVIVCGDLSPEAVLEVLESGPVSALPAGGVPRDDGSPIVGGGRRHLPLNNESAGVVLGGPAVPYGHRLLPAWQVLMDLIGGASSALLFEEIRNRRGLAYDMWAFTNAYRDTGVWRAFVATAPEHVEEVVETATTLLTRRAEDGWTAGEVEPATRRAAGLLQLETEQSLEEALLYGRYGLIPGHPWTLAGHIEAIRAVTAEDVLESLRTALKPLVITVAGID